MPLIRFFSSSLLRGRLAFGSVSNLSRKLKIPEKEAKVPGNFQYDFEVE